MASPVTVHVVAAPLAGQVAPPGVAVTMYPLIADPPSSTGAVQETVASSLAAEAAGASGGSGTVSNRGVTGDDAADGALVPTTLVAVTRNVYAVPSSSPTTRQVSTVPAAVQVFPPGVAVTVYPVIVAPLPPALAGAVHETSAIVLPATPVAPVGAPGTVQPPGRTPLEGADGTLCTDRLLVAVTVKVYCVPSVSPVTRHDGVTGGPPVLDVQVAPPGDAVAV